MCLSYATVLKFHASLVFPQGRAASRPTHRVEVWVFLRANLLAVGKKGIPATFQESNLDFPMVQPAAWSHRLSCLHWVKIRSSLTCVWTQWHTLKFVWLRSPLMTQLFYCCFPVTAKMVSMWKLPAQLIDWMRPTCKCSQFRSFEHYIVFCLWNAQKIMYLILCKLYLSAS